MAAAITPTQVTSTDRLGMTLFIATILHGVIILGISFSQSRFNNDYMPRPLDIILVQTQSDEAPEDAKNIAQFNQQASGSQDTPDKPSSPVTSKLPTPSAGIAATPQPRQSAEVQLEQAQKKLHSLNATEQVVTDEQTQQLRETETPREREQRMRETKIAQLAAELEERQRRYAERPKIHFIDASSAKSAVEARYVNDWVKRVEAIGNLNYPEKAKLEMISGKLILNVLLDHDGTVLKVQTAVSSGSRILDNAAIEIVKISSPFPTFPGEMQSKYDQLMITRTWSFDTLTR